MKNSDFTSNKGLLVKFNGIFVDYNSSANTESTIFFPLFFSYIIQLMVASPLWLFIHEQYHEQFHSISNQVVHAWRIHSPCSSLNVPFQRKFNDHFLLLLPFFYGLCIYIIRNFQYYT